MYIRNKVYLVGLSLVVLMIIVPIASAGNDFVIGNLRVDDWSVTKGQYLDYRHYIYPAAAPNNQNSNATSGWFGIDLGQWNGNVYSRKFVQVGILTDNSKARWFVYAESGVDCLKGTPGWVGQDGVTRGCVGKYGGMGISPGSNIWTRVELATYSGQSWWVVRVYNAQNTPIDVVKVRSGSKQIYYAQATSEEVYSGSSDPHILMNFYHYHPEYWKPNVGFTLWPGSIGGGNHNILSTFPSNICPTWYGAETGIQNNPHLWRTASGDTTCYEDPLF